MPLLFTQEKMGFHMFLRNEHLPQGMVRNFSINSATGKVAVGLPDTVVSDDQNWHPIAR